MTITINIYYYGKSENLKNFVNEMINNKIVEKIRKQPGNLKYEYFFAHGDENQLLLIDKWESQTALDIHHSSKMMDEIISLRKKYELEMKVEKYQEAANLITDNDKKFIK